MKKEIFNIDVVFSFLTSLGVVTKKDTDNIKDNFIPLLLNTLMCRNYIILLDVEKAMSLLNTIATEPLNSKTTKEARYSFGSIIEKNMRAQQVTIKKEARKHRKRLESNLVANLLKTEEV